MTVLPSDVSPIYIDRHPVDLLTDVWTIAGLAYDAAACTALKNLLGAGLRLSLRVTSSKQMGQFLQEVVFKPFFIGVRADSQGRLVPFSTSIRTSSAPTKTITDALIASDGAKLPFEQDVTQGVRRLTFKQRLPTLLANTADGVAETDAELTILNSDANALLSGTVDISVPGMIRSDPASRQAVGLDYLKGTALQLFDRFGRGNQGLERELMRGDGTSDADTLNLGDEALVQISALPNHNKRYADDNTVGARAMQLVRVTEMPDRRAARFADSGPTAQLATAPTLSIAASTDLPRTVAQFTVTNAAALNALGYAVRLQFAATTGAAPAATDYHDWWNSDAGATPTTAVRLSAITAGYTMYIRARSEKIGSRPSNWSAVASVALTALSAPTALAAASVAGDGSREDLSWTPGANASDCLTDVWVRAFGVPYSVTDAVKHITLLPGSTRHRVQNLTPNTQYTATVQHRDPATQDLSARTEVSFTTLNTTYALNPPKYPDGFSYAHVGAFGLVVAAQEFPSDVEFAMATETAVGSGVYGAYVTVGGPVPSVPGDWTVWIGIAPHDGKKRLLKARHIRDGATSSSYTAEVVVTPWSADAIPVYADVVALGIKKFREIARSSTEVVFGWEVTGASELWVWLNTYDQPIASDPWPAIDTTPTTRLTGVTNQYTVAIPDMGKTTYFQIVAVDANAKTSKVWQVPVQGSFADVPQGVVSIDATGVPTAVIDLPDWAASAKYATSTSAQPNDAAALAGTLAVGRQITVTGSALGLGSTFYVTLIPFAGSAGDGFTGVSIRLRATRHDFSASKTIYIAPTAFVPTGSLTFNNGALSNFGGGLAGSGSGSANVYLPDGVTITGMTASMYTGSTHHTVTLKLYRKAISGEGARTDLGGVDWSADTGAPAVYTHSAVYSEATTGNRYQLQCDSSWTNGDKTSLEGVLITYSMPTSDKSI
jgi:hypothetical protein